jgi:hypothetical protein
MQTLSLAFGAAAASAAGLTLLELVSSGGRDGARGMVIFYPFALFFVLIPVFLATFAALVLASAVGWLRGDDPALWLILLQGPLAAFCYDRWVRDSTAFGSPKQVLLSAVTVGLCAAGTSWLCRAKVRA